jgi:hypothetical protein
MWEPLLPELALAVELERSIRATALSMPRPSRRSEGSPVRRLVASRLAAIAAAIHAEAARSAVLPALPPGRLLQWPERS